MIKLFNKVHWSYFLITVLVFSSFFKLHNSGFDNKYQLIKNISLLSSAIKSGSVDNPNRTLIVFMNNAEARIGGGFPGSMVEIKSDGSSVDISRITEVYDYEHRVLGRPQIQSSDPALKQLLGLENLTLKDSSNYLNWPTNLEVVADYYKLYTGDELNNVIAITPEVLKAILNIVGSVYIPEYDLVVTADNFATEVQYQVESGEDKRSGKDPKTILNYLFENLIESILNKDISTFQGFNKTWHRLELTKNIGAWSRNPNTTNIINELNIDHSFYSQSGNFFILAEDNHTPDKSSLSIKQKLDMNIKFDYLNDKTIQATYQLELKREHTSDYQYPYEEAFQYDGNGNHLKKWLIGKNKSLIRFGIPVDAIVNQSDLSKLGAIEFNEADHIKTISFVSNLDPLTSESYQFQYQINYDFDSFKDLVYNLDFFKSFGLNAYQLNLNIDFANLVIKKQEIKNPWLEVDPASSEIINQQGQSKFNYRSSLYSDQNIEFKLTP